MSAFAGFSEEELAKLKLHQVTNEEIRSDGATKVSRAVKIPSKIKKSANTGTVTRKQMMDVPNICSNKQIGCTEYTNKSQTDQTRHSHPSSHVKDTNDNNEIKQGSSKLAGLNNNKEVAIIEEHKVVRNQNEDAGQRNNNDITQAVEPVNPGLSTNGSKNLSKSVLSPEKLLELQLQQKVMEAQNIKKTEMLSKALADRTKQTEIQVRKLEMIKQELQELDGQLAKDVAILRKSIDLHSLVYADAEKHYFKKEKEFLLAKLTMQKEKEKKELLTEHLCTLITHNETRKAQKLDELMKQLITVKSSESTGEVDSVDMVAIVDGVDERTGKMIDLNAAATST